MSQKISLNDALPIINNIVDKPFDDLFEDKSLFADVINKGKSGHLLEHILVGLDLTSDLLDFTDGELKSVIWREYNFTPDDTMAITMVNKDIDDFLSNMPYQDSHVYQKLKNFILVPTVKNYVPVKIGSLVNGIILIPITFLLISLNMQIFINNQKKIIILLENR